jgi:tetratricopeptide (TPR) repeat protein
MRLLHLDSCGSFRQTEFFGNNIPNYAILSHTWGADEDEVSFKDLLENTRSSKSGYDKLRFCGEQAKEDNLHYFWVDTCCIDKSSSAELSEAIISMFQWYQNSAKCYVFLADVSIHGSSENSRDTQLRKSRWFTRGWTLQELIAPRSVEFFSQEGERLGDKNSLEKQLHEITGIAIQALQGRPLSELSVAERISWAEQRQTTRGEDKAYSLLGIFDIQIPVLYGDGEYRALRRLREEINKYSNSHLEEKQESPSIQGSWIVAFERNPHFTGRESQLVQLEEKLLAKDHTTKIAIAGLGGVGKTQLVLELLYRTKYKHANYSIIWIPATNIESLNQAYLDTARQLEISGWEDQTADVKKLVQEHLSKDSAGQWLLVFDNADDMDMWIAKPGSEQDSTSLIDYLPNSKQECIIFTTRDRKIGVKLASPNVVEIPKMEEGEASQLLQKRLTKPELVSKHQDTKSLLAELTYLPLAIVQAAAYINENEIELADYLMLLKEQEEDIIDLLSEEFEDTGRYRDVKNPVATTWLISFEQIRQRDTLAADYLSFMACVDPKDIPQSLLPPGKSRKKQIDAIGTLNAYCFISKRPTDLALDLHRLVHLATRNWLRKEKLLAQSTEKAIERLEEVFPDDHKNRNLWRSYLPHAHYALKSDLVARDAKHRVDLLWKYGNCVYEEGRWNEAESAFEQVMETRKTVLGVDHPSTLTSMANLASTYRNQGRWNEAEELEVQVMETRKRVLGAEHPSTLTSMGNLASTYSNQGRWKEAEELEMQVMETRKRVLGVEHPSTLTSMANLASTYSNQGRWKEAEELEAQVMETRKRVLGAEHPSTLTSMNNLAFIKKSNNRPAEALKLIEECVHLQAQILGPNHPFTVSSLSTLGKWQTEKLEISASADKDPE